MKRAYNGIDASRLGVLNYPDHVNNYSIDGANVTATIPAWAIVVAITASDDVYIKPAGTATAGAATDGTGSLLVKGGNKPLVIECAAMATLGIYSDATAMVSLSYYNAY